MPLIENLNFPFVSVAPFLRVKTVDSVPSLQQALFVPERVDRIEPGRAAGGDVAGDECDQQQKH